MALYAFGDSHAKFCFHDNPYGYKSIAANSVTMHRVGRDQMDFICLRNLGIAEHDIVLYMFGEIDCRCNIHRQIVEKERRYEDVLNNLVEAYFTSIEVNRASYQNLKMIVSAVIPPTRRIDFESEHGPINHAFPFLGTDAQRVQYTKDLNRLLQEYCRRYDFFFFDGYEAYRRDDQTLRHELSDGSVHIAQNNAWLQSLHEFVSHLPSTSSEAETAKHSRTDQSKPRMMVNEYLKRGEAFFTHGDVRDAKICFERILNQDPHHLDALNNLGVIAREEGDDDAAILYFQKALRIDEDYVCAIENYGKLLKEKGHFIEALICFQKVLLQGDTRTDVLNDMGHCFFLLGDPGAARVAYIESLKIDDRQDHIHSCLHKMEAASSSSAKGIL